MAKYQEQFERIRRYYQRVREANNGPELTMSSDYYVDDLYSFFINCFHLKDWLKNDPEYKKHTNQEIEDYFKQNPFLSLCGDLCNGLKHLAKNRNPKSGSNPEFGEKQIGVKYKTDESGEERPNMSYVRIEVKHGDTTYDAYDIARIAMSAWDDFLDPLIKK
jgi:hypothetical protein